MFYINIYTWNDENDGIQRTNRMCSFLLIYFTDSRTKNEEVQFKIAAHFYINILQTEQHFACRKLI